MATAVISEVDQSIVSRDPEVMGGEPAFPGTRVLVRTLEDQLQDGDSIDEFLEGFPGVSREQVVQVLELAFARIIGPCSEDFARAGRGEARLPDQCRQGEEGRASALKRNLR